MSEVTFKQKNAYLTSVLDGVKTALECGCADHIRLNFEEVEAIAMHAPDPDLRERAVGALAAYAMDYEGDVARHAGASLARLGVTTVDL